MLRRFHSRNLITDILTNYEKWTHKFLFVQFDFVPESREEWISEHRVHMDVFYPLSVQKIIYTDTIAKAFLTHGFLHGVPFLLCEREDFNFSDERMLHDGADGIDCPMRKKQKTLQHINAFLPHEVIRARSEKLDALRNAESSRPSSHRIFETGSSSRAPSAPSQRGVPPFKPFEAGFNYPKIFSDPTVYVEAIKILWKKSDDWLSDQLHHALLSVSYKPVRKN